jgi:DNA-binding MarR family transcriptional regulator
MMERIMVGRNPLFLRDEELDRALELLVLAERELIGRAGDERDRLAETDFRILYLVHRHPRTTTSELRAVLGLSKQALSRHVRQLTENGLLACETDRTDRRRRPLTTTAAAVDRLDLLGALHKRGLRRAFMSAGPEAVEGFQRVLTELIDGQARRWLGRRAA